VAAHGAGEVEPEGVCPAGRHQGQPAELRCTHLRAAGSLRTEPGANARPRGRQTGRLLEAEQGLPTILWVRLIAGGIIVVGFTYLFGLDSIAVHLLMVASLALIIALVLFMVAALNFPFKGDITVGPEAMEHVLGRFETSKLSDL
jgi:hypothetical protein